MGNNCSSCSADGDKSTNCGSRSSSKCGVNTDNFNKLTGDCPGNNIASVTNTTGALNEQLDNCKSACSVLDSCKGISYTDSTQTCILKSNTCDTSQIVSGTTLFYTKQNKTPASQTISAVFTQTTGDCAGNDILQVTDTLGNCMTACNSLTTCKGISYNATAQQCVLKNAVCTNPVAGSSIFYSKKI